MDILFLLIPLAVVLAFLIGIAFIWCVRNGQFDDLQGPAYRILADDDGGRPDVGTVAPPAGFAPACAALDVSQRDS